MIGQSSQVIHTYQNLRKLEFNYKPIDSNHQLCHESRIDRALRSNI